MSPSPNIGGTCPPCPIGIDAPVVEYTLIAQFHWNPTLIAICRVEPNILGTYCTTSALTQTRQRTLRISPIQCQTRILWVNVDAAYLFNWYQVGLVGWFHSTQFRSFRRRCFYSQMTQPTVSKHWRTVVSWYQVGMDRYVDWLSDFYRTYGVL